MSSEQNFRDIKIQKQASIGSNINPIFAFFSPTAGEELCWDYNYQVDQVQGKEIYCQCGAESCRGRLL